MKKGFTLIELLVVVLIIGILAAVALPQYTKAVEKARTAEAMQLLGDIATAEQVFYMSHRYFLADASKYSTDLDVSIPGYQAKCKAGADTTGVEAIETGSYCVKVEKSGNNLLATATRKNGTYGGKSLTITVEPSGKLTRSGDSELTKLAGTWAN